MYPRKLDGTRIIPKHLRMSGYFRGVKDIDFKHDPIDPWNKEEVEAYKKVHGDWEKFNENWQKEKEGL